ncbi:AgmX/PglI C-terminal domain-containing protein [Alteromonadaceae bacterium M269]|nr:AgmX/PglI C-terminal domain-containing protein [Alteromonadaceae bacterium M269]
MSTIAEPVFNSVLPWSSGENENKRFTKITYTALAVTLTFSAVVKWQQLPEQPRAEKEKLPPQLVKIIKQKEVVPPPPIVKPKPPEVVKQPEKVEPPKVEKKPEPKPEPKQKPVEKVKPKPVEKPKVVKADPKPVPKPEPTKEELTQKARETAKESGLLAFQDDLASMRSDLSLSNNAQTEQIKGAGQSDQTQRQFIGKKVAKTSGGLDTSKLSSDIGSRGNLAGRKTTEFVAPNEGFASLAAKQIEAEETVIGDRDVESIRKVLDANKGPIYAIYRRALRKDPSLQGKVNVRLVIEPNGSVSSATIIDSELEAPALESKLLARIKLISFGEQNVTQTTLEYGFNFLPF